MSKDLNQCNFIGRVGKDIELKYTAGGSAVANFSIACGDDYKDKQGNKVEQTNWISIVIFGKLAEICGQYLTKGSQVYISGKQVTRKWQDQSGADRYTTEIVASEMQMLGSKGGAAPQGQNEQQQSRPQQAPNKPGQKQQQGPNGPAPTQPDDWDDDIPFSQ